MKPIILIIFLAALSGTIWGMAKKNPDKNPDKIEVQNTVPVVEAPQVAKLGASPESEPTVTEKPKKKTVSAPKEVPKEVKVPETVKTIQQTVKPIEKTVEAPVPHVDTVTTVFAPPVINAAPAPVQAPIDPLLMDSLRVTKVGEGYEIQFLTNIEIQPELTTFSDNITLTRVLEGYLTPHATQMFKNTGKDSYYYRLSTTAPTEYTVFSITIHAGSQSFTRTASL